MSHHQVVIDDFTKQPIAEGAWRLQVTLKTGGGTGAAIDAVELDFASLKSISDLLTAVGAAVTAGTDPNTALKQALGVASP